MRSVDSTVALSDIVAADLLTGRRSRPDFELEGKIRNTDLQNAEYLTVHLYLEVVNSSLVWIDDLRVGVVYEKPGVRTSPLPFALRSAIDADVGGPHNGSKVHTLASNPIGSPPFLAPFETAVRHLVFDLPRRQGESTVAIYVAPKNHPAAWWEATFMVVNRCTAVITNHPSRSKELVLNRRRFALSRVHWTDSP